MPLELWKDHKGLMRFIDFFNGVKGSRTCNYNIDAIEISDKEISIAKKNKKAVKIGIYDFENGLAIENGFYFGYMCIRKWILFWLYVYNRKYGTFNPIFH